MEGEKHYQISPELMMINFFSLFLNVSSCGYSLQKKKREINKKIHKKIIGSQNTLRNKKEKKK